MTKVKVLELQNELTILFKEWIERLTVSGVRLEEEQNALREHIDKEFIDINCLYDGIGGGYRKAKNIMQ